MIKLETVNERLNYRWGQFPYGAHMVWYPFLNRVHLTVRYLTGWDRDMFKYVLNCLQEAMIVKFYSDMGRKKQVGQPYDCNVNYTIDRDREEVITEVVEDFLKDCPSGGYMFVDNQFEKKV